ncbi:MAG: alpha/beta hydrolase [Solirubrobacteraceae bacterium]
MTISSRVSLRGAVAACLLCAVCAFAVGCGPKPGTASQPVRERQNLVYGRSSGGQALTEDVYSPNRRTKPAPLLIALHGGGFTGGDKQGTAGYAAALAAAGFVTINVNYSLTSPGYPEQVKEIQRAIRWNVARAGEVGGDPHRVGVLGFSAGGYLGAMAALLDDEHSTPPVDAVVTLSAPLDLPALDRLLRARLAACGSRPSCSKMPHMPPLSAFGTLYRFLGCPTGNCSPSLIREASPSNQVTAHAPAFLMLNSTDELIPVSQPGDMADALRVFGVPAQVVIVPGAAHAAGYVPRVSPAILKFLRQRLGSSSPRLSGGDPPSPSGDLTLLLVCCALIFATSLALILAAARRRRPDGGPPVGELR